MLVAARNLTKSFGPRKLFTGISLSIEAGQHIGLIGANGSGKSTLLKIFAGTEAPDDGEIVTKRQLRVAYAAQEETFPEGITCLQAVARAVVDPHADAHERELRATILLDRAAFGDTSRLASSLSGGWKKRLAIVRQLAADPELLLMDEPTNHLDVESIEWLEETLTEARFATLIVSHDRRFLEAVSNRTIEIGRVYPDGYLSHNGPYSEFVEKREEFIAAQQGRQQSLAGGVRREIEWLQRGAKARTTKAKGRIDRAGEMIKDLADIKQRNTQQGAARIDFAASDRRTKKLIELKGVSKSLGGRKLFSKVDLVLSPGTRLGLLGPNGSGKSTFIKTITGELTPDAGTVFRAEQLRTVVFDQHRAKLDPTHTLRRALSPNGDNLIVQGRPMHVSGWARQFLFQSEQLDMPVGELSGGEQARVLIAQLMLQEADVLILDEPTNDLDIPTLQVLEESLEQFPGALLMVTHDRFLLDRVSTTLLALDGEGAANVYAELSQWEAARAEKLKAVAKPSTRAEPRAAAAPKKKLSWNEQKEFDGMEAAIHKAEESLSKLEVRASEPAIMADHVKHAAVCAELAGAHEEVGRLYARWTELEAKLI